jgi:ribosome-binding protein aMBF1 (putative translation factor)
MTVAKVNRTAPVANSGKKATGVAKASQMATYEIGGRAGESPTVMTFTVADMKARVARNIANGREAKGLSQRLLAERLGIRRNEVSRWENGGRSPRPEQLHEIAEALDLDPGYFYVEHNGDGPHAA